VVVPTYNERENIPRLIPAILEQGKMFDVLVVDDNSPDGTGALVEELAQGNPRVDCIHRDGKRGLGTAYVAGFQYALDRGYDFVFEMDADFSHDPADLPRLLAAAQSADVALGSRWIPGGAAPNWSPVRVLVSRGGSLYARAILGIPIHDLTTGFKCFRSDVLRRLNLAAIRSNGYAFQVEVNYICYRLGFRLVEVPIVFVDRRVGRSKMSTSIVLEAMGLVWKLRLGGSEALRSVSLTG